jgi:hypothetical protein
VTTTAKSGRYEIVTDYTTDPSRPTVLIRSKFVALKGRLSDYRLYVRHDPTLNGNGGGGTGSGGTPRQRRADNGGWPTAGGHTLLVGNDPVNATNAANRDIRGARLSALDVRRASTQATNGFAGQAQRRPRPSSTPATTLSALHDRRRARQRRAGGARARSATPAALHAGLVIRRHAAKSIAASQGSLKRGFHAARRDTSAAETPTDAKLVKPRRPGASRRRIGATSSMSTT